MFQPLNDGVPFLRKRDLLYYSLASRCDEENQANMRKRMRWLSDEVLSSTINNSETFRVDNLHQTHDSKPQELPHLRESYGFPSSSKVYNLRHDLDLPSPKYTPSVHCRPPAKPDDLALTPTDYVDLCHKRDFAFKQSKTEAVTSTEERGRKCKIISGSEQSHEFNGDNVMEKKRKDRDREHSDVGERADKRESYWERRRRNNASAKKSRDARKAREIQTQIKVDFLEKENTRMLAELLAVRHENVCLRRVLSAKM